MAKFRKKPVMIEAQQVTRDNLFEVATWCNGVAVGVNSPGAGILIDTLEGQMKAALGDWIIKGVNGEFYPCKPDIFEKTYDPVEDTETLEAGVVVVPAEVAAVLADEVRRIAESLREFCGVQRDEATPGWLAHWEKRVQAWATLVDALSRLQQNGGE